MILRFRGEYYYLLMSNGLNQQPSRATLGTLFDSLNKCADLFILKNSLKFNKIEYLGIFSSAAIILLCISASNFTYAQTAQNTLPSVIENPDNKTRIFSQEHRGALLAAVDSSMRIDKARDKYRHPAETLEFFGILPSDTVIEIWPGQGWYSSILGPYLKSGNGRFIGAHFDTSSTSSNLVKQIVDSFRTRFGTKPDDFGDLSIVPFGPRSRALGTENSVDAVLTFRNVHNWMAQGWAEKAFDDFYKVLKPGGVLGIEEHRADDNSPQDPLAEDGYVREDYVIDMAKEAGFELVARSQINANPKDTKDHPFGVWTLPPVGRTSAPGQPENIGFDKTRYIEIGESDRMTLLFRKPLAPPPKANNTIAGIRVPFPIRIVSEPKAKANKQDAATPKKSEPIIASTLPPSEPVKEPVIDAVIENTDAKEKAVSPPQTKTVPAWIPNKSEPLPKQKNEPKVEPSSVPVVFEVPPVKSPETAPSSNGATENVAETPTKPAPTTSNIQNNPRPSTNRQPPASKAKTERPVANPPRATRANQSTARPSATRPNNTTSRNNTTRPSASAPRAAPKAKVTTPKAKAAPKAAPPRQNQTSPKAKPKALNIPTWNPNPPKKKN